MSYRMEKNGAEQDLVFEGWEQGIAPSPHKGIANIKNGNISTESGEVTASFSRAKNNQTAVTNGTLTTTGSSGTTYTNSSTVEAGQWINVSAVNGVTYVPPTTTVSALVVGGGAAGGGTSANVNVIAGGGGGGQVNPIASATVAAQAYTITVGNGGTATSGTFGGAGGTSSFASFGSAIGGGGGGTNTGNGQAGASGGGGGGNGSTTGGTGSAGSNGGNGVSGAAGGGGGAGAVGSNGSGSTGGNGGNGTASSISGASVTYGGGGGGAAVTTKGTGGTGGGGDGGIVGSTNPTAGTDNLGGGGGGAENAVAAVAGGAGGKGVVIISYPTGQLTATGGTITTSGGNTIHTFNSSGTFTVTAITSVALPTGAYYVSYYNGTQIKLSFYYDPTGANAVSYTHAGTLTYSTTPNMGSPVAKAIEKYNSSSSVYYRYYVLDSQGLVWVYDTGLYATTLISFGVGVKWFLPDKSTSYWSGSTPSGIGVLNGWLLTFAGSTIKCKETVNLGDTTSNTTTYRSMRFTTTAGADDAYLMSQTSTTNPHYVLVGHQGRAYYTDGNFIGSIFPDTSLLTGSANIQSYCSYTALTTTGTITSLINGSVPFIDNSKRFPVVFFPATGSTLASALTEDTIFWVGDYAGGANTFRVYAASTGGSPLDIQTGATGTQYFNSFFPVGDNASAGATNATVNFSNQRVNLPTFEITQSLVEVGNVVLIGCTGNIVYPWNQVDALPSGLIALPENNVSTMVTVNQMAYIFAGTNGNIYITDGSTASLVLNIPDYCAGVPGSPGTYIEPNYYWGDAMYLRGRVYFSVRDQTATKTGNCGGVWSFVPTQNLGQDTGIALRLEAENSYLTYNGVVTVFVPSQVQDMPVPLYWSGWYSDITTPTYGIDYSNGGTLAGSPTIIETDLAPVGTFLNKRTFKQIEYKLASPLDGSATVTVSYRTTGTAAWTSCGTFITDSDALSGYVAVNFEKIQWLQLQVTLTPITSSADTNTFIRFKEVRVR